MSHEHSRYVSMFRQWKWYNGLHEDHYRFQKNKFLPCMNIERNFTCTNIFDNIFHTIYSLYFQHTLDNWEWLQYILQLDIKTSVTCEVFTAMKELLWLQPSGLWCCIVWWKGINISDEPIYQYKQHNIPENCHINKNIWIENVLMHLYAINRFSWTMQKIKHFNNLLIAYNKVS